MKLGIIKSLCGGLLLYGCSTQSRLEVPTDKVTVTEVNKNFTLLNPIQLVADGNLLWISDYNAPEMVWVMDMTTGDSIAAFLKKGKGAGEGRPPIDIQTNGDKVLFCTNFPSFLLEGDKMALLQNRAKALKQKFMFPPGTNCVLPLSDTTFLTSGSFEEGRFRWINILHPDSVTSTGVFPDLWSEETAIPIAAKNRFHYARLFRNFHNGLVAVSTPYVLSFYRPAENGIELVKDTLLAEYQYDYQNEGMLRMSKKRENIVNGCRSAAANDHHIYLLFDSTTAPATTDDKSYPLVQVYDWNGRHVRNLDPGCKLNTLTVDGDDQYLYALTDMSNDNGPKIVRVAL